MSTKPNDENGGDKNLHWNDLAKSAANNNPTNKIIIPPAPNNAGQKTTANVNQPSPNRVEAPSPVTEKQEKEHIEPEPPNNNQQPPIYLPPPPINNGGDGDEYESPDDGDEFKIEVEPQPVPDPGSYISRMFNVTREELEYLMRYRTNPETWNKFLIFLIGVFLTPISLTGSLIGFVRSYNRFERPLMRYPFVYPLRPITRVAMVIGAVFAWLFWAGIWVFVFVTFFNNGSSKFYWLFAYMGINALISSTVFGVFLLWQRGIRSAMSESRKFGSARFARPDELPTLVNETGFYIGHGHAFDDKGHILTVAGTRGGKGTSLIIPNLLGVGPLKTSWVIIDPKGENAAITARYQRELGQNVVILNPWNLLEERLGLAQSYNPMDMLSDKSNPHLVDDVMMLAEMIVPVEAGSSKDPFWSDTARSVIAGVLLYIAVSQPQHERNLTTLWKWVRLFGEDWDKLIQDMGSYSDPINGDVVNNAANEILKLSAAGDDTFGSIMSGVLQATDFLKSPALQKSLQSGFDPKVLADGKTTVYVIIPADKLKSHSRWLRLVTTSMLRAVIRKPGKRVTFLLDEFAALGYLPEIEIALSTYAGFNVTIWAILQSLVQLENLYDKNWQLFISSCTVRQFFTVNDQFTAEYVSTAIGHTSNVMVSKSWFGVRDAEATPRLLITPDELRIESGKKIFMFVADLPPTYVEKFPYHLMPVIKDRADKNPYI